MIPSISPRDRRVLALGAAAVSLLLLFSRGLPAWRRWDADARAGAAELVRAEAAARARARGLGALVDSAEARHARVARLAPALLDGDSPASAGATLAAILTGAAARSGVRLGSVQVTPDTLSQSTFARVAVRADAIGDLQGITEMLQYLENVPELLVFRDLAITQPDAGGGAIPEALQVEITVQGLALVRPSAPQVSGDGDQGDGDSGDGDSGDGVSGDGDAGEAKTSATRGDSIGPGGPVAADAQREKRTHALTHSRTPRTPRTPRRTTASDAPRGPR